MIEVLINYGGAPTEGRRILPGVYADDDAALFGLADYLVANGHAVRLDTPAPAAAEETTIDAPKVKGKRK